MWSCGECKFGLDKGEAEGTPIEDEASGWAEEEQFECRVPKNGRDLGLVVDYWVEGVAAIQVTEVLPEGATAAYNDNAPPVCQVKPLDFLLAIDDAQNPEELRKRLAARKAPTSKMRVLRPMRLDGVFLDKGSGPLGLKLIFQEKTSRCLLVKGISTGAAMIYNSNVGKEMRLVPGDIIISVNDFEGMASELMKKITSSSTVELSVLRLPEVARRWNMNELRGGE